MVDDAMKRAMEQYRTQAEDEGKQTLAEQLKGRGEQELSTTEAREQQVREQEQTILESGSTLEQAGVVAKEMTATQENLTLPSQETPGVAGKSLVHDFLEDAANTDPLVGDTAAKQLLAESTTPTPEAEKQQPEQNKDKGMEM